MAKKGGCERVNDTDFAVLDKIRKPEASLDDLLPYVDQTVDNDMLAH